MLTIVHGSDLHFGKAYRPSVGEAFRDSIEVADPDVIVLSGDFTQRAKVREYEEARAFLDTLPDVPVVVTPGNHDVPLYRVFERLFHPHRNYREHIRDELDHVTRVDGAVIVSLDSSAPHHAVVNGRIRPEQVEFAARAFEEAPEGAVRVVVAHHHFAPAPDYEGDNPLPRAREILDDFTRMGVELILGGHLHRAYIGNSLDVYQGSDRRHGIVIVQSGTTTSARGRARERAKNSFNVVRVGGDKLEITHQLYVEDLGTFAPFSVHAYPRRTRAFFPPESEDRLEVRVPEGERGAGSALPGRIAVRTRQEGSPGDASRLAGAGPGERRRGDGAEHDAAGSGEGARDGGARTGSTR